MNKILFLLDQIIEKNIWEDNLIKDKDATGDNWDVHHLKLLKEIIIEEFKNAQN